MTRASVASPALVFQLEEEFVARKTLELFDTLGEDKIALGMIEERVLTISYGGGTAPSEEA